MVTITRARMDEIVGRLNDIESRSAAADDAPDFWAYVLSLAEFDARRLERVDPAGTSGHIPLVDGSMIYWLEHRRAWSNDIDA
jgi:hypothetical protein